MIQIGKKLNIFNYKFLSFLLLCLSLVGAIYLVQLNQENRSQAELNGPGTAKNNLSQYDLKQQKAAEDKLAAKVTEAASNPNIDSSQAAQQKLKDAQAALKTAQDATGNVVDASSVADCKTKGGSWCGACGGFCSTASSCDSAGIAKCNEYPSRGGTYVLNGDPTTHIYHCTCGGQDYGFDKPGVCNFSNNKATSFTTNIPNGSPDYSSFQGTDTDGLCHIIDFTKVNNNLPAGTKTGGWCADQFYGTADLSKGCQGTPVPANFNPSCFCGTVQIDTTGQGFVEKTMKCGCSTKTSSTPQNTPTTPVHTPTPTKTSTPTPTRSPTLTPTQTPTATLSPSATPTGTLSPSDTPTSTPTVTPTNYVTTPTPPSPTLAISTPIYSPPQNTPTRIVLPDTGIEFPGQIITVVGIITTLFGFLILL